MRSPIKGTSIRAVYQGLAVAAILVAGMARADAGPAYFLDDTTGIAEQPAVYPGFSIHDERPDLGRRTGGV
jgi:hypothetical protein